VILDKMENFVYNQLIDSLHLPPSYSYHRFSQARPPLLACLSFWLSSVSAEWCRLPSLDIYQVRAAEAGESFAGVSAASVRFGEVAEFEWLWEYSLPKDAQGG